MKLIPLTKGLFAKVDDEDFESLKVFNWCLHSAGYARRTGNILMHRIIMAAPKGIHIDHINGDKLDNRKVNLRFATRAENSLNKNKYCGEGQYKGVHLFKRTGKYTAYIKYNKKKLHLGYFDTAEKAALAWNKRAIELYGDFAKLNEVK